MILFYAVFLISFLVTKTDRRPSLTIWREADTKELHAGPASSSPQRKMSPDLAMKAREKRNDVTLCITPSTSFFKRKKIRNGTLFLNCKSPTPYCDFERNICVRKIPITIKCDVDGQYPHIADCRGSVICTGGKLYHQFCSEATSYDYKTKLCVKGKRKCVIPNCTGKSGSYVRHPADRKLFVLCLAGVPSSLYICPPGYLYSGNYNVPCDLTCLSEGTYPDIYDKTRYYVCSSKGSKRTRQDKLCPQGTVFNQASGACGL